MKKQNYKAELLNKREKAIDAQIDVIFVLIEDVTVCMVRDDFSGAKRDFKNIERIAKRCADLCLANCVRLKSRTDGKEDGK
jgi:hypothetical protein